MSNVVADPQFLASSTQFKSLCNGRRLRLLEGLAYFSEMMAPRSAGQSRVSKMQRPSR